MEDVTDTVFRRVVAFAGKPDIFFTEFTNVDGLLNAKGRRIVGQRLKFSPEEKPLIAQIWGNDPEKFYLAAKEIALMGFDGIDINMGCPQRKITKQAACAALIKTPDRAVEIIAATKKGIADSGVAIPLSVKTRIGFSKIETTEWIGLLLKQNLDALSIHARTAKEMSLVPAHHEEFAIISTLKKTLGVDTTLIANGDIKDIATAHKICKKYSFDGAMIGRGIFSNPWVFNPSKPYQTISVREKINLMTLHIDLYEQTWGLDRDFQVLKRFFKIYVAGFDSAAALRAQLMETSDFAEARKIISDFLLEYPNEE
jgi:tRNA-dihydrouridine synthase